MTFFLNIPLVPLSLIALGLSMAITIWVKYFSNQNQNKFSALRYKQHLINTQFSKNEKFILYLRGFARDGEKNEQVSLPRNLGYTTFTQESYEMRLSQISASLGCRLFGVAKPISANIWKNYDPIGAARRQMDHDKWKKEVSQLMNDSPLIFFRPYPAAGIIWEFNELYKKKLLQKTIIFIPFEDQIYYPAFQSSVHSLIGFLPSANKNSETFIYFDSKNRPISILRLTESPKFTELAKIAESNREEDRQKSQIAKHEGAERQNKKLDRNAPYLIVFMISISMLCFGLNLLIVLIFFIAGTVICSVGSA